MYASTAVRATYVAPSTTYAAPPPTATVMSSAPAYAARATTYATTSATMYAAPSTTYTAPTTTYAASPTTLIAAGSRTQEAEEEVVTQIAYTAPSTTYAALPATRVAAAPVYAAASTTYASSPTTTYAAPTTLYRAPTTTYAASPTAVIASSPVSQVPDAAPQVTYAAVPAVQEQDFVRVIEGTQDRGKGRGRIYDNIIEAVGNTPCIKISDRLAPPGRTIYAKCEFFNPLGSVKDRLAMAIIEDAEAKGLLGPGSTVVEATSGNTGIGIAMVCAQRGYRCVICMAESFSVERRKLMRMLGAQVVLTPAAGKGSGMVKKARELAETHGWFYCRQFENEANPMIHAATTGPEILADFEGLNLDYFVLGYGTGGTFSGAGPVLKAARPDIKIVLAEPEPAPLLQSGVPSERNPDGSATGTHPHFKPHPIQGWTPDFIPQILEDGVAAMPHDLYVPVPPAKAIETAQLLASTQGIFTGISGGASMYAALEAAKEAPEGSVLLAMIADTGERYLSTPLFADIQAEMSSEELELSMSTPSFQIAP